MFSVSAGNTRDANQGEDLVITRAPHGGSNWMTQEGEPNIAVCVPHTAVLAVQTPNQAVRGASFEQTKQPDSEGNYDFLNFIDGSRERVPLNKLPGRTKVRVLELMPNRSATPVVPVTIGVENPKETNQELVSAGRTNRRGNFLDRLFD